MCCVLVAQSYLTLCNPHWLYPARLLCPCNSPGKNTRVEVHSILWGIFPTQGSNPDFMHCKCILYHLNHQGCLFTIHSSISLGISIHPWRASQVVFVVKNLPANQEMQEGWFDPWVWKIPWRRAWQSTSVILPGEFHGQRSLAAYSSRVAQSRTWLKWLSTHACIHPWKQHNHEGCRHIHQLPNFSPTLFYYFFPVEITLCMRYSVQFSSVSQSCPTLCDPMNCSTPGLLVHHQLPEFTQTHVHRVGDAIQPFPPLSSPSPPLSSPSPPLLSPSSPAPNRSKHQGLFQWVNSSREVAKVLEFRLQHQSFQWTPRTDLL